MGFRSCRHPPESHQSQGERVSSLTISQKFAKSRKCSFQKPQSLTSPMVANHLNIRTYHQKFGFKKVGPPLLASPRLLAPCRLTDAWLSFPFYRKFKYSPMSEYHIQGLGACMLGGYPHRPEDSFFQLALEHLCEESIWLTVTDAADASLSHENLSHLAPAWHPTRQCGGAE